MSSKQIAAEEIFSKIQANTDSVVVDLRSPLEFSRGHIPGALNIPLLDNEERRTIGTLYKQQGKTVAVQIGLDLFAAKADNFLSQFARFGNQPIVLYCWRGGMRSKLVAEWLGVCGFNVAVVKGGYKGFRVQVLIMLEALAKHPLLVVHGMSGCGKTELIQDAIQLGLPAIDLEALANHRGSAFGDFAQEQAPSTQQQFENLLAATYFPLQAASRICIEIEDRIGPVAVSRGLRKNILSSPLLCIERSLPERAAHIAQIYGKGWNQTDLERFRERIALLSKHLSHVQQKELLDDAEKMQLYALAEKILQWRYDPRYKKSMARLNQKIVASFEYALIKKNLHAILSNLLLS